jgi:hypothetical protein
MDISKLTDEEIAWYAERDWTLEILGNYSCGLCQYRVPDDLLCIFRECPKFKDDYKDAAEFEARVAAKLANKCTDTRPCIGACKTCEARRLKHARLAVEAEMEMEKNNEKQSA